MNAILSNPDRERLAKLLGMLGSDPPGERDAAGLAAHRLVKASGLTWSSIVCIPQDEPEHHADPLGRDWRRTAARCRQFSHLINVWEERFLADIPPCSCCPPSSGASWSRSSPGFVQRGATYGRERARR